jgi:hypothetical protein
LEPGFIDVQIKVFAESVVYVLALLVYILGIILPANGFNFLNITPDPDHGSSGSEINYSD